MYSLKFIPDGTKDELLEKSQVKLIDDIVFKKGKNMYYRVECIHCGKQFDKPSYTFGISQCQCIKYRNGAHNYKGVGDVSAAYYNNLKNKAAMRRIAFDISPEDMWNKLIKQNKCCALTGLVIHVEKDMMNQRIKMTASLDRIDSKKPYTPDNIQWVHKDINRMKNNYSEEYFIKMCKLIIKHNGRKNK